MEDTEANPRASHESAGLTPASCDDSGRHKREPRPHRSAGVVRVVGV